MTKTYGREIKEAAFEYKRTRWEDEDIEPFLEKVADHLRIFTAQAGTLVMFDSSLIHSGQPITKGTRYSLTNYYYGDDMPEAQAQSKWSPTAGPIRASA